ncbi:HhH-GPD-type base excision DNA repair protein [Prescottella agglutinans]|uniref:HhH-GPD-type base excision DNA repair protein n=1 Tax=Prescottella agglutinans TaxID=1644129 RepID=UPI003D979B9E
MALTLNLVGDPEADALLASDPLALLIGMLLDQQVPMETAFAGPKKLDDRLGGLDVHKIAQMNPDDFIAVCAQPPAVHRFPKSMGERIQSLCGYIVEHYDGDTAAIWTSGDPDGKEVLKRLKALPGYGDQKARIFLALLGKQIGVQPKGWREAAGSYGDEGSRRSIADVVDRQTLLEVREFKQAAKAAAKAAKGK